MPKRRREVEDDHVIIAKERKGHADLKLQEKWAIVAYCMGNYEHDASRMGDGRRKEAAERFDLDPKTINRVLKEYLDQPRAGEIYPDMYVKSVGQPVV